MSDIRKREGAKGVTYQVRYPNPATKSGYAYKTFRTMKEARAFRESAKPVIGQNAGAGIRRIEQAIDKWLETCEMVGRDERDPVSPATLQQYEYRARAMKSYDWTCDLHTMRRTDVKAFRSWLKTSFTPDKARKVFSSFRSVMLEMYDQEIIAEDPTSGLSIAADKRHREPVQIPTVAELGTILQTADRLANSRNKQTADTFERYRAMLYLAADSGMRPQEYLVLPLAGLENNGVRVMQALDRSNRLGAPKTQAGRRFILTGGESLAMARAYAVRAGAEAPEDFVFPARRSGSHQAYNKFLRRGWHPLMDEAGLSDEVEQNGKTVIVRKYTPYALRHFFASMLIEKSKSPKYIQTMMGHEDITMTYNVYGHLIRKHETEREEAEGGVLRYVPRSACGILVAGEDQRPVI